MPRNSSLVDAQWLAGRFALIEKVVASQLAKFTFPSSRLFGQVDTGRLHWTDDLTSANVPDATSAIRLRAGRVFPAFAAILIPASVLSKKSARLSMSV